MVTVVIDISIIMFFIIALVAVRKNALYEIDYGKSNFLYLLVIITSVICIILLFILPNVFQIAEL